MLKNRQKMNENSYKKVLKIPHTYTVERGFIKNE